MWHHFMVFSTSEFLHKNLNRGILQIVSIRAWRFIFPFPIQTEWLCMLLKHCSNFISCELFFRNQGSHYFLTVLFFSSSNRPLILERHIKMIKELEGIMWQATEGEQWSWNTYVTIVGLCQMGHNNFCVSFCSHSSRVYKRTQVCYTTTDMERHRLSE